MTTCLIVDDRRFIAEVYRGMLTDLGHDVVVATDPAQVGPTTVTDMGLDLALVDLSFPDHDRNGQDVLLCLHRQAPTLPLAVLSQADEPFQELLRHTHDALPLRALISQDLLPEEFAGAIATVLGGGTYVDPLMQMYLPARRHPARGLAGYRRLIGHAGHARLWRALATAADPPSYADLSAHLGTSHNTVRNYRDDLGMFLQAFGLDGVTSLVSLHAFARATRPFLLHAVDAHLAKDHR